MMRAAPASREAMTQASPWPPGPWITTRAADADAALEMRPADAVRQRHIERRHLARHVVGELCNQRLRIEPEIFGIAAPQARLPRSSDVKPYIFSIFMPLQM